MKKLTLASLFLVTACGGVDTGISVDEGEIRSTQTSCSATATQIEVGTRGFVNSCPVQSVSLTCPHCFTCPHCLTDAIQTRTQPLRLWARPELPAGVDAESCATFRMTIQVMVGGLAIATDYARASMERGECQVEADESALGVDVDGRASTYRIVASATLDGVPLPVDVGADPRR